MEDKRKNNGGHKTAGRKSKAEEIQLIEKLGPMAPAAYKALKDGIDNYTEKPRGDTDLLLLVDVLLI